MLVEEYLYSAGECWDLLGTSNFFKADSSLTLLGESITDLLEILCLLGLIGRPVLLGESMLSPDLLCGEWRYLGYVLQPTLVPWWMEQLDRLDDSLLPLFLR